MGVIDEPPVPFGQGTHFLKEGFFFDLCGRLQCRTPHAPRREVMPVLLDAHRHKTFRHSARPFKQYITAIKTNISPALPCRAPPSPAPPCQAAPSLPRPDEPSQAQPRLALPRRAFPALPRHARPSLAKPGRAKPRPASPRQPCPAPPSPALPRPTEPSP